MVVESRTTLAFCAGYLRPRIYLSTGSLQLLPQDELRAVVAHEAYHAKRFEPLRLLVARVLADALFFIPALSVMSQRYASLCELAADRAAVEKGSNSSVLARAMLRFEEDAPGPAVGISPERVDSLLGEAGADRWKLAPRHIAASVGAGTVLLLGLMTQSANAGAIDLGLVVAQSCMLMMIVVPIALAFSTVALVRRRPRQG